MKFLVPFVLVCASSISDAAVRATLLPQYHQPMGATWERTGPDLRAAVVASQTEILNYLFGRRAGRVIAFSEANHKLRTAASRSIPMVRGLTVSDLRRAFDDLKFPIRADQLSEQQRRLLFSTGAAAVALSLGWVEEMPVAESSVSQHRTMYRITADSLKLFYGILRRRGWDGDVGEGFRNPMASSAIFDIRERDVLSRVISHSEAAKHAEPFEYVVIFGAEHLFTESKAMGVELERVDTRTKQIMEELIEATSIRMQSQVEACLNEFEALPPNAGIFRTMRAMRKVAKAKKSK